VLDKNVVLYATYTPLFGGNRLVCAVQPCIRLATLAGVGGLSPLLVHPLLAPSVSPVKGEERENGTEEGVRLPCSFEPC